MGRNSWLNLFIFLLVISLSIRFGIRLLMFGLKFWYITIPLFLIYYYLIKPKKINGREDTIFHQNHSQYNQNGKEIYIDPKDYKTMDIDEDEGEEN